MVLVPQGMSYAKVTVLFHFHPVITKLTNRFQIATLPPQYGLYSSFVGVFVYCVRIYRCNSPVRLTDALPPVLVCAAIPLSDCPGLIPRS